VLIGSVVLVVVVMALTLFLLLALPAYLLTL
jgi:hypothetical protein